MGGTRSGRRSVASGSCSQCMETSNRSFQVPNFGVQPDKSRKEIEWDRPSRTYIAPSPSSSFSFTNSAHSPWPSPSVSLFSFPPKHPPPHSPPSFPSQRPRKHPSEIDIMTCGKRFPSRSRSRLQRRRRTGYGSIDMSSVRRAMRFMASSLLVTPWSCFGVDS